MADKLLETLALAEEAIEEGLATFSIPTTAKIAEALAAIREQKAELESYGNNITSHNLSIKQEPVAWAHWKSPDYAEDPAFLVTVTEKPTGWQTQSANWFPLYAAPVRTKDLTDVEVEKVWRKHGGYMVMPIDFARAVITADREKTAIMALDVDPVSTSPECVDETGKAEQHVNWSWKYNAQWEGYFCYPKNDTVPFAKIIVYGSPEEQDRDMRLIAETMGEQSTNLCQNPDKLVEKRGRAGSFGGD